MEFRGGTGAFVTDRSVGPFEPAIETVGRAALNRDALKRYVRKVDVKAICSGEEMLILVAPEFRAPADRLANWKNSRGLLTTVIEVNDGSGPGPDSALEIDALIEERYNNCLIRPSYLLLFGDAEQVPTFVLPQLNKDDDLSTDFPYACMPGCSELEVDESSTIVPSFAVGRLSVQAASQGDDFVDKIIGY